MHIYFNLQLGDRRASSEKRRSAALGSAAAAQASQVAFYKVVMEIMVMVMMMTMMVIMMMMVMIMTMMMVMVMMMVGWQRCASRRLLFCSILQLKCSSLKFFMLAFIIIFILKIILIIYHSSDKVPFEMECMVIWYYICELHHFHSFPSFAHIKKG